MLNYRCLNAASELHSHSFSTMLALLQDHEVLILFMQL
jgi:hypothetical protein